MSDGAGCPVITPSTALTSCSISTCSCLLRFLLSGFVCRAYAAEPAIRNARAVTTAVARRLIIRSPCRAASSPEQPIIESPSCRCQTRASDILPTLPIVVHDEDVLVIVLAGGMGERLFPL